MIAVPELMQRKLSRADWSVKALIELLMSRLGAKRYLFG